MGLTKLVIFLDRPIYYPGEIISGRLLVEVDKPISIRVIYLKYSGKGGVLLQDESSGYSDNDIYSNTELYLGLQQLVSGNDSEDYELAKGEYVFVFHCQLPNNLPSSFEGAHGNVRYFVTATVKRHWKPNYIAKQPITIGSIRDLNHIAFAAVRVVERVSKTFWGHPKPLTMSVNLPVRGFVSGETMTVIVTLDNKSEVQVESLCVSLVQRVICHAPLKSRTKVQPVAKSEFPILHGYGYDEMTLDLQLPILPPSYLEHCKIIDLDYQLIVEAKVQSLNHLNLILETEIIVGNIPLMNYQNPIPIQQPFREIVDYENPLLVQASSHQPPAYDFGDPPGMIHDDLPSTPPTYEENMSIQKSE